MAPALLLLVACAAPDPEAARAARLLDALEADNRDFLARDPDRVADKYARMAADPYDFFRGTLGWWWSELARPDPDRRPTAFLRDPDAAGVLLVGDLHVENVGTCLPGDEPGAGEGDPTAALLLEAVDLDAATFGPWTLDVRRTAASFALLAGSLPGCADACVDGVVAAYATAYADEIARRGSGEAGWDAGRDEADEGAIVAKLRERGREDGLVGAELADRTEIVDNRRRLLLDEALDAQGGGMLALTDVEAAQLGRVLDAWTDGRPDGFRVLDAARRYGAGVSSLPALRYAVVWDTGGASDADDHLLNVREVVEPPAIPGLTGAVAAVYPSLAARVRAVADVAWSEPDADVLYAGVADGGLAFKLTAWSGWLQHFDHAGVYVDWLQGELGEADLAGLAMTVGRLHAGVHARAPLATDPTPGAALPVVAGELAGAEDTFVAEVVLDARADAARILADHALFGQLLDARGPLLGADTLGADVP